jgi:hypothetical protein
MCLISGAQRKPRFSQATLKNGMEAFFNILLSLDFLGSGKRDKNEEGRCIAAAPFLICPGSG